MQIPPIIYFNAIEMQLYITPQQKDNCYLKLLMKTDVTQFNPKVYSN